MRVDYQREDDKTWYYLQYSNFSVGSASEEYPLTVGGFTGVGTDWFNYGGKSLNGMKFSTLDNKNNREGGDCAIGHRSGWWYNDCGYIYINRQPPFIPYGIHRTLLFTEMKIRPKDCIKQ